MEEISFDDLKLKLKTGELNYLNLYNVDLEAQQYRAINHYSNSEYDTIENDQKLSILFHDIEVYSYHTGKSDTQSAPNPISAITIFNNFEKIYHCYFLVLNTLKHDIYKDDLNRKEEEIRNELLKLGYIKDEDSIKIHLFKNELELLKTCWSKIHEIDPSILTGFYSGHFDLPYIYNRLLNLLNGEEKDVNKILSKFGVVKPRKTSGGLFYQIAEYPLLDIQALYKPRDEGGFNYGKKRSSYSLDFLSEVELNLKKIEYKDEGMSLDKFYEVDPWGYIKYNIVDVALTARLDEKLKHIDFHNMLRRDMKTPMSTSIRGSSTFFDTTFSYQLDQQGKYFRYGIVAEKSLALSERDIKKIPKPKQNKIKKWTITKVDVATFTKILGRYPGAYVKDSYSQVIDKKDGIVVDMDASLPPWEKIIIKRDNIIYYGDIGDYTWQEGDKTLTWDDKNETCWKEVLGKTEHDWDNELVKITTETGKKLTVTTNHSIFGVKQKDFSHTTTQLIDAGKLKKGDYVTGLKKFETDGIKTLSNPELIGFWLSDGWSHQNAGKYFLIAKQDVELLEIFQPDITNIRMKRTACQKYKEEWVGNINKNILNEFVPFTTGTKLKSFIEILNYNYRTRKRIWEGMMFADGMIKGYKCDTVLTPTERLCKYRKPEKDECFVVAHTINWKPRNESNGIANCPTKKDDGSNRYGPDQVCQEIFKIKGSSGLLTRNNLCHNCRHTFSKIKDLLPHIKNCYSDYVGLEKVKKIERKNYSGKVHDISVKDTERFFAGTGIGAHNTALYP